MNLELVAGGDIRNSKVGSLSNPDLSIHPGGPELWLPGYEWDGVVYDGGAPDTPGGSYGDTIDGGAP